MPNEEIFDSNMDWIHNLMLNTTRQNFLRQIEKLDNVVLLSPHRVPFMDRFLGKHLSAYMNITKSATVPKSQRCHQHFFCHQHHHIHPVI